MHGLLFNIGVEKHARSLGAHRIATHLRKLGWDIEVIDHVNSFTLPQLIALYDKLSNKNTKWVGFSHVFVDWNYRFESLCNYIRSKNPDIKFISGGGGVTNFYSDNLDWHIHGYGEDAIVVLLKYLFSNGRIPKHRVIGGIKNIHANDDYLTAIPKDPVTIYQDRDFIKPYEWLGMQFSRGCKFSCKFCNHPLLGVQEDHTRSQESFEIQIKDTYDRFGVKNYLVSDETFNDSTAKITKYADVVENLSFNPFFSGNIRLDLLIAREKDREELRRMRFLGQFYGIESFDKRAAKSISKGMDPERIKEGVLDIKKYYRNQGDGIYRAQLSFIAGLPYETKESLYKTKKWLIDNWKDESFIFFPLFKQISLDGNVSAMDQGLHEEKYSKISLMEKINFPTDEYITEGEKWKDFETHSIYWKNDQMDCYDALRFATEMVKLSKTKFPIGNWSLGRPLDNKSVESRIKNGFSKQPGFFKGEVKEYYENKLNQ